MRTGIYNELITDRDDLLVEFTRQIFIKEVFCDADLFGHSLFLSDAVFILDAVEHPLDIRFKIRAKDPAIPDNPGATDGRKQLTESKIKRLSLCGQIWEAVAQYIQARRMTNESFNFLKNCVIDYAVLIKIITHLLF